MAGSGIHVNGGARTVAAAESGGGALTERHPAQSWRPANHGRSLTDESVRLLVWRLPRSVARLQALWATRGRLDGAAAGEGTDEGNEQHGADEGDDDAADQARAAPWHQEAEDQSAHE